MSRLWDKGGATDSGFLRFTVGDDHLLDQQLIPFDLAGCRAHVAMLAASGLLENSDVEVLTHGLDQIEDEWQVGSFTIAPEQEDGHTAIEARLTEIAGDAGQKIHAGRSRNDQAMTMLRLAQMDFCDRLEARVRDLIKGLIGCAERHRDLLMPGYTHLQRAMPSSPALWSLGYAEALADRLPMLGATRQLYAACPLGSAAGYGTPMALDRKAAAAIGGFERGAMAVTGVQLARGLDEHAFAQACAQFGLLLSRLGADGVVFMTKEFALLGLPKELTSGSSIMPNKVNPDLFELIRAHGAAMPQHTIAISQIIAGLPGGYQRDLQLVKRSLLLAFDQCDALLEAATMAVQGMHFNAERCDETMDAELYATAAAYRKVRAGVPFRQAYREAAGEPASWTRESPEPDADSADNPAYATRLIERLRERLA